MIKKRIDLIEKYLKQEGNAKLVCEMSEGMIQQLCADFRTDKSEIIGFYEDVMQLGGAIFASLRSRHNTRGVLFLRDKFLYNKGILLHGIIEMPYDRIKYVERNLASTVIYTGEFNEDGTNKTLKLSGISFEESSPVPMLLEELRNLNEDTIEIGKMDKLKDTGIRAKKVLNILLEEGMKTYANAEAKAEAMADEIIAKEPSRYTPVGNREEEERIKRQREAVEKAKAFKAKLDENRERSYAIAMEKAEKAKEETERAKTETTEDDQEYECFDEVYSSGDDEEYVCETETDKAADCKVIEKQLTSNNHPKSETKIGEDYFLELIENFECNLLKDEILTKPTDSMQSIAGGIWMYLNRSFDSPEECFFDFSMTLRIQNRALYDACHNDFRVPNEFIHFGFAENGIERFQSGFAVTNTYLLYKLSGKKASNIPLRKIYRISSHGKKVVINNEIEIDTSHFSYSAKLIADILNFFVVKYLKKELLI